MKRKTIILITFLIVGIIFPYTVTSDDPLPPEGPLKIPGLQTMLAALAALLFMVLGLKFMISDNESERAEIKKGLVYIVVGILIVYAVLALVKTIFCANLTGVAQGNCYAIIISLGG